MKNKLRKEIKAAIGSLVPSQKSVASWVIAQKVMEMLDGYDFPQVMFYHSLDDEVETRHLLNHFLNRRGKIILPKIEDGLINAYCVESLERDLVSSTFWGRWSGGIMEPAPSCQKIAPDQLDAVIVPGRAFDSQCNRLGRGKGHYDSFFKRTKPDILKIGLGFNCQLVEKVPVESHDIPLDYVVTDDTLYVGPKNESRTSS